MFRRDKNNFRSDEKMFRIGINKFRRCIKMFRSDKNNFRRGKKMLWSDENKFRRDKNKFRIGKKLFSGRLVNRLLHAKRRVIRRNDAMPCMSIICGGGGKSLFGAEAAACHSASLLTVQSYLPFESFCYFVRV